MAPLLNLCSAWRLCKKMCYCLSRQMEHCQFTRIQYKGYIPWVPAPQVTPRLNNGIIVVGQITSLNPVSFVKPSVAVVGRLATLLVRVKVSPSSETLEAASGWTKASASRWGVTCLHRRRSFGTWKRKPHILTTLPFM